MKDLVATTRGAEKTSCPRFFKAHVAMNSASLVSALVARASQLLSLLDFATRPRLDVAR